MWGPAAGGRPVPPPLDGELALASHWVVMPNIEDWVPWGGSSFEIAIFIGGFILLMVIFVCLCITPWYLWHRYRWVKKYKPKGWTWEMYRQKHISTG